MPLLWHMCAHGWGAKDEICCYYWCTQYFWYKGGSCVDIITIIKAAIPHNSDLDFPHECLSIFNFENIEWRPKKRKTYFFWMFWPQRPVRLNGVNGWRYVLTTQSIDAKTFLVHVFLPFIWHHSTRNVHSFWWTVGWLVVVYTPQKKINQMCERVPITSFSECKNRKRYTSHQVVIWNRNMW